MTTDVHSPNLQPEKLPELIELIKASDSVELKLSVPDGEKQRSAVASLRMDVLDAQLRQVAFFDTPGLKLDKAGVVVRARRVQARPGDVVVKLRPLDPRAASEVRQSSNFGVEVDVMPSGFVCSGSMKSKLDPTDAKDLFNGRRSLQKTLTKEQRALYSSHAPGGVTLDDLHMLGPINILKLKFTPTDFDRRLVAELWFYPDGSRILELSTKCAPSEPFEVAAATRAFLARHDIDTLAEQQTKTRAALSFFTKS